MLGAAGQEGFRHEALLYAGEDEFVERTSEFILRGIEAGEPTLVVVSARKIDSLRERLPGDAEGVYFADMSEVGRNPGPIIPAWRDFVSRHSGAAFRLRGIGEPIFPERSAESMVECQRHEELLNVAFDGSPSWWLLCPYDTDALEPAVVEEALRSHPYFTNGRSQASPRYRGLRACSAPVRAPLPDPPAYAVTLTFDRDDIDGVRRVVASYASELGFGVGQRDDFSLAAHELAANSVRHGGGSGVLRLWGDEAGLVADVSDAGSIEDPLAGRIDPRGGSDGGRGGRGLWLVNQLCDLIQIRSHPGGSTVRAHLAKG